MNPRARLLALHALTCVTAFLLCLAGTASGKAALSPEKNASGNFFVAPGFCTGETAPETLQPQWEIGPSPTQTASGRQDWLSPDPIGEAGGLNLYGYVSNNVINFFDPYGLEEKCYKRNDGSIDYGGFTSDLLNEIGKAFSQDVQNPEKNRNAAAGALASGLGGPLGARLVAGRSGTVTVTRWQTPASQKLNPGDWVIKGGKTPWNWLMSGKANPLNPRYHVPFRDGRCFQVLRSSLKAPGGWEKFKALPPWNQWRFRP